MRAGSPPGHPDPSTASPTPDRLQTRAVAVHTLIIDNFCPSSMIISWVEAARAKTKGRGVKLGCSQFRTGSHRPNKSNLGVVVMQIAIGTEGSLERPGVPPTWPRGCSAILECLSAMFGCCSPRKTKRAPLQTETAGSPTRPDPLPPGRGRCGASAARVSR